MGEVFAALENAASESVSDTLHFWMGRDEGLSNKLFKKLFRKFQKAILFQGGCFLSPDQSSLVILVFAALKNGTSEVFSDA